MQYRTTEPIKHDGRVIPVGTLIDLPDGEGAALVKSGAVELAHKPFLAKPAAATAALGLDTKAE